MKTVEVFERLTFTHIITIWFSIIILFSITFFAIAPNISLNGQSLGNNALGLGNAVYFSFITATTIGYGDIAPLGFAKVLAIIEAIASMSIFGLFIGKIVSVKQEEIIEEVKELSFEETSNTAISELYLFRNEVKDIRIKPKSGQAPKEFTQAIENLNDALTKFNSQRICMKEDKEQCLMRIGLISNSINFSLSRLVGLLEEFNDHKIEWKNESTTATLAESQKIVKTLYEQYDAIKSADSRHVEEKLEDLNKTLTTMQKSFKTA